MGSTAGTNGRLVSICYKGGDSGKARGPSTYCSQRHAFRRNNSLSLPFQDGEVLWREGHGLVFYSDSLVTEAHIYGE